MKGNAILFSGFTVMMGLLKLTVWCVCVYRCPSGQQEVYLSAVHC